MAAQQTAAAAAVNRAVAPREPRPGNLSDFMKLSPAVFTGTEEPLAVERWITDMANLLEGANIPAADQVKMVKLRLTDIARSWWLAEEAKLTEPITWKQFSDSFDERFFPESARKDMEEKFIGLKQ